MRNLLTNDSLLFDPPCPLGRSLVDILICTPGRLLEHLENTPGFTLMHLKFLVLDEADRLLSNAYHHWVRELIQSSNSSLNTYGVSGVQSVASTPTAHSSLRNKIPPTKTQTGFSSLCEADGSGPELALLYQLPHIPPQRLLFSATLTNNPRKLTLLGIENPLLIRMGVETESVSGSALLAADETRGAEDGQERENSVKKALSASSSSQYVLPSTLSEAICACDTVNRWGTLAFRPDV